MAISAESSVNHAVTMNETLSSNNNSEAVPLNIVISPPSPLLPVSRSSSDHLLAVSRSSMLSTKTESIETPYVTPSSSVENLTE